MKSLLLFYFVLLIASQDLPRPYPFPQQVEISPQRPSPNPPQKLNFDLNSFSYNQNLRANQVDGKQGLPYNVSPRRPQNLNLEYNPRAKNIQNDPFQPPDYGIDVSNGNTCQTLKYFAFRTGTNNDATKTYLTEQGCVTGSISFKASSHPQGRPGDNQLWISYQRIDKSWIFESKNCPNYFIRATSSTQINLDYGAYLSSTFEIQYHQDHEHLQSHFLQSHYWALDSPLELIQGGASKYIVQFWPQFLWK